MARLSESVHVAASLAETWGLYFDPRRWAAWVDGFARVEASDGYPEPGGTLIWISTPSGRGRVSERVLEHEPRRRHRIAFSDPESAGELLSELTVEGEGTRVTLTLDYRLVRGGPLAALSDRLFVRGQLRASLRRSLLRLRREAEEIDPGGGGG